MRKKGGSIRGKLTRWAISRLKNSRTFPIVMNAIRRQFGGGLNLSGGCRGKGIHLAGSGTTLAGGRRRRRRRR